VPGSEYVHLWSIPWNARTGRYEVDITAGGNQIRNATSFAVHRQWSKVVSVELDKTFYTSGDTVNPRIVVRNLSDRVLDHLQVEFEPYTYPWIAPAPDEPPIRKHIVASSLSLGRGAEKSFDVKKAAVIAGEKEPEIVYYSVVIRDNRDPDRIYDLAFAPASDHAPYREAAIPNLPYALDSVVSATKDFIMRFHPELIITEDPDERHVDHRTNNWMVVKAMQELLREGKLSRDTQLVVDAVYGRAPAIRAP
jgi:hypothetical protein